MKKTLCVLTLTLGFVMTVQAAQEPQTLVPGKAVEREIAGGESHTYQISLTAGQFMRVVVEQKGIDVAVQMITSDGKPLIEADFTGTHGKESLSREIAVGGDYRMVVRTQTATAPKGGYEMRLQVKAAATEQDKQRVEAERLLAEAGELNKRSGVTLPQALEKAQQAMSLWRGLDDRYWQAYTLHLSGYFY